MSRHVEFNLIRFGRQAEVGFMAKWTSLFSLNDFETYQNEITQLVDTVEFLPNHAYAEYQAGDSRAPYQLLTQLITGTPSEGFTEFSNAVGNAIKRDEEKKQAKINGLLVRLGIVILAIIGLLASWAKSRKEKGQNEAA
jgi:hypothetical protein